jgi:LacI family transcriptional regulator
LAIGVLRAMRDLDLNVPADCSVVGFDDIELASLVVPRLTTIRQPTELLARAALEHMISDDEKMCEITVKGELVIRGSTGKLLRGAG